MPTYEPIGNRKLFQRLTGGYGLTLVDEGVRVEVRYLRREHGTLVGEMDVLCEWAGASTYLGEGSLSCADLNLSSQTARNGRGKYCAERAKTLPGAFDWTGVIDEMCRRVIEAERNGLEAIVLDDAADEGPPDDVRVYGLSIPADSHSQLVADGGGLKSLILLLVLGEMARQGRPVLYVDWEWNERRHKARKQRLFGRDRLETLHYLRARAPITQEKDHIRRVCDQRGIQFIGLDSIGAACDGKLADDDVARAYNRALDDLPPSLAAAHVPKNGQDPKADLKAFGSAFFHNFARMTWTVRKQADDIENLATVLLTPHKQNDGARVKPVALEFTFAPARIAVQAVDPTTVEGFAERLPLPIRMRQELAHGARTYAELAAVLEAKVDSIIKAAKRGLDGSRQTFVRVRGADGINRLGLKA